MDNEAPRACASCKRNKRGCDKTLPKCGLCIRYNRICDYSETSQFNHKDEIEELRNRIQEIEQRLTPFTLTPAASSISELLNPDNSLQNGLDQNLSTVASYLDSETWSTCNMPKTSNHIPASEEMSAFLGNSEMEDIKYRYFNSVHTWMPIVSKIRLERITKCAPGLLKSDTLLLILCMKLICTHDQSEDRNLYNVAKKLSQELELKGLITVRTVQAALILCVYEVGHAIFPAAFLNISCCARQGVALGLHNKLAPQLAGSPRSWVDWEERQRVWWMVVILDRYIAIGYAHRPLCTEDPNKDTLLPASDSAWDDGEMMCPERVLLSSNSDTPVSAFARLAQASNLLGRVIKHCNETSLELGFVLDNFERLTQTIIAFLQLLTTSEDSSLNSLSTATAICFSALFKLASHHSCDMHIESEDLGLELASRLRENMQRSVQMLKDISNQVILFIQDARQSLTPQRIELVSPLVLNCIYSSTANLSWMGIENGAPQYAIGKAVCEEMLHFLSARWNAANAYLELQRVADLDQEEHS